MRCKKGHAILAQPLEDTEGRRNLPSVPQQMPGCQKARPPVRSKADGAIRLIRTPRFHVQRSGTKAAVRRRNRHRDTSSLINWPRPSCCCISRQVQSSGLLCYKSRQSARRRQFVHEIDLHKWSSPELLLSTWRSSCAREYKWLTDGFNADQRRPTCSSPLVVAARRHTWTCAK